MPAKKRSGGKKVAAKLVKIKNTKENSNQQGSDHVAEKDPTEIFPEEVNTLNLIIFYIKNQRGTKCFIIAKYYYQVWRIILLMMSTPQDIRNCMKTCVKWEWWLETKRTLVHFRDVSAKCSSKFYSYQSH